MHEEIQILRAFLSFIAHLQPAVEISENKKVLMRVFCLFLSIYILLLSFAPCGEMTAKVESRVSKSIEQTQLQSSKIGESGDDCSPFCVCSCCHFSTAYQFKTFSVTNKVIVFAVSTAKVSYQNPYAEIYKTSVWQPPKFNSIG